MSAYYSENDKVKAAVLREAIRAGAIAPGDVDERSITDIRAGDLVGYTQCHFFAGGGFWSLALRLAGWPDDRPVWTGSCPCPSFSAAGKGGGFDDPRHLWPDWDRLIEEYRPAVVFGEQTDDAVGYGWLDLVQTDLERKAYAVGKAILGACSVGAPHIRQRLYFVGDAGGEGLEKCVAASGQDGRATEPWPRTAAERGSDVGELANTHMRGRQNGRAEIGGADECRNSSAIRSQIEESGTAGELGDAEGQRRGKARAGSGRSSQRYGDAGELGELADTHRERRECQPNEQPSAVEREGIDSEGIGRELGALRTGNSLLGGPVGGYWGDAEWIPCRNPKVPGAIEWRPIKRGTFVLAARYPERVAELRLAGDAINVYTAKAFIEAYLESEKSASLMPP